MLAMVRTIKHVTPSTTRRVLGWLGLMKAFVLFAVWWSSDSGSLDPTESMPCKICANIRNNHHYRKVHVAVGIEDHGSVLNHSGGWQQHGDIEPKCGEMFRVRRRVLQQD